MAKKAKVTIRKGNPFPLGVSKAENGIQFAVHIPNEKEIELCLYQKGKKLPEYSFAVGADYKTAHVFSVIVESQDLEGMEYAFKLKGRTVADFYARKITGMEKWGVRSKREEELGIRAVVNTVSLKEEKEWSSLWKADKSPNLPFEDVILYQLHVRGFTKHNSSKIAEKGTFKGIEKKIPYLKELGVTSLLLLPAYEFDEWIREEDLSGITKMHLEKYKDVKTEAEDMIGAINIDAFVKGEMSEKQADKKVNYWGYGEKAWYFAPKTSYAYDKTNPEREFKELVAALHKEGMELLMDMHFAKDTNPSLMIECLRHWVLEYHVDGFRINDNVVPAYVVAADPIIGSVKLLASGWDSEQAGKLSGKQKHLAEFNDGFMDNMRCFLKGDESQVPGFFYRTRRNPDYMAVINYIANNNSFTLQDMVSYDVKHNEANGENGRDGSDSNHSWNCGAEGKTRKKNILELRKKQMKNALLMLFLSQGTPLLLAGDEFGDSREGNNNPYCQDNEISWLNWDLEKKNEELLSFVKEIIALRKEHRILHMAKELRATDYAACGYPDISFHGMEPWYPDEAGYNRMAAVMLAGKYAGLKNGVSDGKEDDNFYVAYNMHWEEHEFALPDLNEGVWEVLIDTGRSVVEAEPLEKVYMLQPRSVVVMIGHV